MRIKEGREAWNAWRSENFDRLPDLSEADLSRANLSRANLSGADLSGANLSGANLSGADLIGAYLTWANLSDANLSDANLSDANLTWATLIGANLSRANLSGADLSGANLTLARLSEANLTAANLSAANFSNADLSEANLSAALLSMTVFADVDLSAVKGLDAVRHVGPSTIGIDTLYGSKGNIPETFLRGCGVSEQLIAYARSLVANPIEFYSCFISHSSLDQEFAERLHADLRAKGLRVWFAPEDLKIGTRFQEEIEKSLRVFDKVMIVLSEASVKSRWVEREVNAAMERETREDRTVLFPIRIDDAVMSAAAPWAADIRRQRHIGDFSVWKNHDGYQKVFARLLRDLKAEA